MIYEITHWRTVSSKPTMQLAAHTFDIAAQLGINLQFVWFAVEHVCCAANAARCYTVGGRGMMNGRLFPMILDFNPSPIVFRM